MSVKRAYEAAKRGLMDDIQLVFAQAQEDAGRAVALQERPEWELDFWQKRYSGYDAVATAVNLELANRLTAAPRKRIAGQQDKKIKISDVICHGTQFGKVLKRSTGTPERKPERR